jgi:hypothetical protein
MLVVMADESGATSKNGHFAVAGFNTDHVSWVTFSEQWKATLQEHGAPYLHRNSAALIVTYDPVESAMRPLAAEGSGAWFTASCRSRTSDRNNKLTMNAHPAA